jgi:hypothetical protein
VVAALSSAMNANVEGVRRGGKAPEVLEGEQLYIDAQTDLGMLYVRVSINASLFSLLTHLCFASQQKSQLTSVKRQTSQLVHLQVCLYSPCLWSTSLPFSCRLSSHRV